MTELPVNMRNIEVLEKIAEVGGSNGRLLCSPLPLLLHRHWF
jgi:hypothetical protein